MGLSTSKLAKIRADYLIKKEQLLIKKVDELGIKLFKKVFDSYLKNLEQLDGKLLSNKSNLELINGLDKIYDQFNKAYNIPVVKGFITDLQGITPLNESYFTAVVNKPTKNIIPQAKEIVDRGLGLDVNGNLIKNGFADKFIRDKQVLKAIKKESVKAITQGKGFIQFKNDLKKAIQGEPRKALSGKLQQYYRNYAYDTYSKVDRVNSDIFADKLKLRYFRYSGGIIKTTRQLCRVCNGKIVDAIKWSELKHNDLKAVYQHGVPLIWNPLEDLGGYACRHVKDYIANSLALRLKSKWLNYKIILK